MFKKIATAGKYLGQTASLMVGVPNYDTYVQHMQTNHPGKAIMTYEEFFINRQNARYGGATGRCC